MNKQKIIFLGSFIFGLSIVLACICFAYKHVKDTRDSLHVNSEAPFLSVRGDSRMSVTSDRAIITFDILGKGKNGSEAFTSFYTSEKSFYETFDKEFIPLIKKTNTYSYDEGVGGSIMYTRGRSYEIVLDNTSMEIIDTVRRSLESKDELYGNVHTRFTVINPEEKFDILTEQALASARKKAETLAEGSHARLGDVTYVAIGSYYPENQTYENDTAYDLFYNMASFTMDIYQQAYINYEIR